MPRRRYFEPFTTAILAVCVGWWLYHRSDLRAAGALTRHDLWNGEFSRLFKTIITHGNLTHMLLNCLAIYFIGPGIAAGLGGGVMVSTVLFCSLGGLGASLLAHEPHMMLVGISGGVMGLLGLILAVEWRMARTVMEFFRRRNTKMVIFFVGLNAVLAVIVEMKWPHIRIDHAAHVAGLLVGLFGGLAYFGVHGTRIVRCLAVIVLLVGMPIAYAAYPYWDLEFFLYRARQARVQGDEQAEAGALERVLALDLGNPVAASRLATLRDDPSRVLKGMREVLGDQEKRAVVHACLTLAEPRLESDPETARALLERALEVDWRDPSPWIAFAVLADKAGKPEMAALAHEKAVQSAGEFQAWQSAAAAIPLQEKVLASDELSPEKLLSLAQNAARIAHNATAGLPEPVLAEPDVRRLERSILSLLTKLAGAARKLAAAEPPPDGLDALYSDLEKGYRLLANATPFAAERAAKYLLRAAAWRWVRVGKPGISEQDRADAANLFKGALNEARESGDDETRQRVELWFKDRGLPVPGPDLADGGGGD